MEFHVTIDGMTCGNCVAHVTKALQSVKGVKQVRVALPNNASITSKKPVDGAALVAAVAAAGYEAKIDDS